MTRADRLDDAEAAYRLTCRALVLATRDEVASSGPIRRVLSRAVELLAAEAQERWRCVLALAASPE